MNNTHEEIDRAVTVLLDLFWTHIAASGWNRYQLHGRGALLASVAMLNGQSHTMDYITGTRKFRLPDALQASVDTYDPLTSVVLIFVEDEVYQRVTQPLGPEGFQRHEAILTGVAYHAIATRTPVPSECARRMAH